MIPNDTDIAYEFENFLIENRIFHFCVGETGGGHLPATFWPNCSNFLLNSTYFDSNFMDAVRRGRKL